MERPIIDTVVYIYSIYIYTKRSTQNTPTCRILLIVYITVLLPAVLCTLPTHTPNVSGIYTAALVKLETH